ncbi:MAG: heme A synthase [Alphaproteobacteria bacterium]|jgi:heme a synthase|nr:heme A synthase [Alphaproteobacteria bacterium]
MSEKRDSITENPRALIIWLVSCATMVAAMMLIGAVTRLTESGLSMVEWRPLIGALPPLSTPEWERIFDLYRKTSEYRLENAGMSLSEFKTIFWWEFIHRLWGRLIGVAFGVPLIWYWWRGYIPRRLQLHLIALFVLGGAQGIIGWWMVKSGFVDRHDVSQYRLTVHLSMAFLILGYMLWLVADLATGTIAGRRPPDWLRHSLSTVLIAVFVTVMSGGLVAGLGAGFDYNTWPLIAGAWVPSDVFGTIPFWSAAFEDILTVQFDHRMLAYATVTGVLCTCGLGYRVAQSRWQKLILILFAGLAFMQFLLGIATLLSVVAIPLAVMHQAGAILLFSAAILARQAFHHDG